MRRSTLLVVVLAAVALTLAAAAIVGRSVAAGPSVLSRGGEGWLVAQRYLEAKATRTELLDRGLDSFEGSAGVLVVGFPWQRLLLDESFLAFDRHFQRGGTVLFAFSGEGRNLMETAALEALGLDRVDTGFEAPLHPVRWWRYASRSWSLRPEPGLFTRETLQVGSLRWVPSVPAGAEVLYRDEGGRAAVFACPRRRGRLVVLPSDALANARIGSPGNADLLETLRVWLGPEWTFDEFHHGLAAPVAAEAATRRHVLDVFLVQLALLYGLGVAALGRRFGPAWEDPPVTSGSTRAFLVGLGRLHDRLRHHGDAARRLAAHVRELEGAPGPAEESDPDAVIVDPAGFLESARRSGRLEPREGKRR